MVIALLSLAFLQPSIGTELDALAKKRDVAALMDYVAEGAWKGRNPLQVIKTNGAYEAGKFGWTVVEGGTPNGKRYVVFSTPLTSEDVGERLFETDGRKLTRYIDEREDFGWSIEAHYLNISFDIPAKKAIISDRLNVRREGAGDGPLILRLGPNYRVKSMKRVADDTDAAFTQMGGIVFVHRARDRDAFLISYEGIVDKPNYAGSINPTEVMLTNDYWYPMIARKPSPYGMAVVAPKDWTVVGQGEFMGNREATGDNRKTLYRMDLPCTYWSLNVGPYKTVRKTIDGRKFTVWSKTLTQTQMEVQAELFPLILKTFETFADFPFSGYGACVTPLYGGGALEAYSFATYGFYPGEEPHEPAHTWWGGLINNTYLNSLWNESFAVWSEGFYGRNAPLGNKAERALAFIQTPQVEPAYDIAPLNDASPEIGPAATTLGYGKGAHVLQMFEQEVGTETMLEICRAWLTAQNKRVGGEWEDFEAATKLALPRDMTWFFDQWIRRPGYPTFGPMTASWSNGTVTLTSSVKGNWKMTADVLLRYRDGRQVIHKATNSIDGSGVSAWQVESKEKPVLVSFDPWRRLIRKFQVNEEPTNLATVLAQTRRYTDPARPNWLKRYGQNLVTSLPKSLANMFIVGSPETLPAMKALCDKVGFVVKDNHLTYKGTTIDLNKGGALAVVDLASGGQCIIGLGNYRHDPNYGRARLVVFDDLGRFVRGVTDPKTNGALTFRL